MGLIRIGAKSRIGVSVESAVNTSKTTQVLNIIPIAGGSTIGWTEEGYQPDEIRADPNPPRTEEGLQRAEGTIVSAVENDMFGFMSYLFFGGYDGTGGGPLPTQVNHVFTIDTSIPDTVEVECGEVEQSRFDLLSGQVVTGLEISAQKESSMLTATWSFSGTGKYTANATSSIDATATESTLPRHSRRNLCVEIDGSTTTLVTNLNISIQRAATRIEAMDSLAYAADIHQGRYEITLEVEGYWDQADTIRGLADGADHTLKLVSYDPATPANTIEIYFPEVRFYHVSAPGIPDDMPAKISVQGKPYYLDAAEGSSVEITVNSTTVDNSAYSSAAWVGA